MKQSPRTIAASFIENLRAKGVDELNSCISDLGLIAKAVRFLKLTSFFKNPNLDFNRKAEWLSEISDKIGAGTASVKMATALLAVNQLSALPKVVSSMKDMRLTLFGIGEGEVTTASPLTDRQKKETAEILKKAGGFKDAIITEIVNPNILGGIKIAAADRLLDATLQRQIKNMLKIIS